MQDYKLCKINESIDEKIESIVNVFHMKTCNKILERNLPFDLKLTDLNVDDIKILEKSEHIFTNNLVKLSDYETEYHKSIISRKNSAEIFVKKEPVPLKLFLDLINSSFGLQDDGIMPYPSGGALYSAQLIIYIKNVEGIEKGCYHYLPFSRRFEKVFSLEEKDIEKALFMEETKNFINYDFFILYSSLFSKHISKYQARGYRLGLLEVGSMYRNLEILIRDTLFESRVWGGFEDNALSIALGVDPRIMMPVICQIVGRK